MSGAHEQPLIEKETTMYRQGDVLLIPVPSIPAEAAPNLRQDGPIVLAYGEASGHAHVIADREVQVWQHQNVRYLRVPKEGAAVTHETHRTIDLAPGH
jgi:hypothetical protein